MLHSQVWKEVEVAKVPGNRELVPWSWLRESHE